jgi:hypothetical protein
MPRRITKIPFSGGSRRIPTGAMQFEEDWPGLFVRGDDAIGLLTELRRVKDIAAQYGILLGHKIETIAEIIEQDVIERR